MKRNIKELKRYQYSLKEYLKKMYFEDGVAVIKLDLPTVNDFLHPLSSLQPILNSEVATYIEDCAYNIPTHYPIRLEIIDHQYSSEEKQFITTLIQDHFGIIVSDKRVDLAFNKLKTISLFVIGSIILLISYLVFKLGAEKFLYEVISIAGTFAIWEFVNSFLLERHSIKIEKLNASQLACAEISFI